MALPITIPNTFAGVTGPIPLSQLDNNFSTVVNGINGIGNGTNSLANVSITGGSISNVSMSSVDVSFLQSGANAVTRTVQSKLRDVVSVKDFGAVGNGVADDTAAIQAALNSGSTEIFVPPGTYYCASAITVSPGSRLYGATGNFGDAPTGSKLVFAAAVVTCLTLGNGASNNGSGLYGIIISRLGTAPASNTIGVLINGGHNVSLNQVVSDNHGAGFSFVNTSGLYGIGAMCSELYTSRIVSAHTSFDTWPEARFTNCRFGKNGSADYSCETHALIKGGVNLSSAGPNSISFVNTQFNQGTNGPNYFIKFQNKTAGTIDATIYSFISCHAEGHVIAGIYSDSSWDVIKRLQLNNFVFNAPGVPFLALNAATQPEEWAIDNSAIYGSFSLTPTPQINFINLSNTRLLGAFTLTMAANSSANISGCSFGSIPSITGSNVGAFSLIGNTYSAGNPSWPLSITGSVTVLDPQLPVMNAGREIPTEYRFQGTCDAVGTLTIVHGLGNVGNRAISADAVFRNGGPGVFIATPLTFSYMDGTNLVFTGSLVSASQPATATINLSAVANATW